MSGSHTMRSSIERGLPVLRGRVWHVTRRTRCYSGRSEEELDNKLKRQLDYELESGVS